MALGTLGGLILATTLCAQEGGPGAAWRGAGPQPCFGPEGGSYQCPQLPGSIAIRAGRLLDSKTGQMLPDQVVLILNDRIAQVGPAAQIKIPDGARVIDLSKETVLPGLIDAHTHMFENPKPGMSRETSTLIAIQNTQLDLLSRFRRACARRLPPPGYRVRFPDRHLIIVRRGPVPSGPKTRQLFDVFQKAGGVLINPSDDDLRTFVVLRMLRDQTAENWPARRIRIHGCAARSRCSQPISSSRQG